MVCSAGEGGTGRTKLVKVREVVESKELAGNRVAVSLLAHCNRQRTVSELRRLAGLRQLALAARLTAVARDVIPAEGNGIVRALEAL